MLTLVVDTVVAKNAGDHLKDADLAAATLLGLIIANHHRIALDPTGEILGEYGSVDARSIGGAWLKYVTSKPPAPYISRKAITDKQRFELTQKGFHFGDLVFVEVAARSGDRILITTDGIAKATGDFNANVRAYLLAEFGIRVLSPGEALGLVK